MLALFLLCACPQAAAGPDKTANAGAQQGPPASLEPDMQAQFAQRVHELELLVVRPLDPTTKQALRRRLDFLIAYLEATDSREEQIAILERRLLELQQHRVGVVEDPQHRYGAYLDAIQAEEDAVTEQLQRLRRRPD